jgi:hypothetical protein
VLKDLIGRTILIMSIATALVALAIATDLARNGGDGPAPMEHSQGR